MMSFIDILIQSMSIITNDNDGVMDLESILNPTFVFLCTKECNKMTFY